MRQTFMRSIEAKERILYSDSFRKNVRYKKIRTKMAKQIICMTVKNWINLDEIQFWFLDLDGTHLDAIALDRKASVSFCFEIMTKFLCAC